MSLKATSVTGLDILSLDHRRPCVLEVRYEGLAKRCNAMVGAACGAVPTAPRGSTSPQDRFQDLVAEYRVGFYGQFISKS
jgi:hypothetical protein